MEDIVELEHLERGTNKKIMIKMLGGVNNGDIFHIFLKNEYKSIPVQDKTIVDIGANIADSSIYSNNSKLFNINSSNLSASIFFDDIYYILVNILDDNI